jgi:hypothetical protein
MLRQAKKEICTLRKEGEKESNEGKKEKGNKYNAKRGNAMQ